MSTDFDVIVVGGGHNGLTAAAWLAKAGRKVLVLERRDKLGGAASTEELIPGFRFNTGAPDAGLLLPRIIQELDLHKHGLDFVDSPVAAFAPQPDGSAVTLWRDAERSAFEIATFSASDARAFLAFQKQNERFAEVIASLAQLRPFAISNNSIRLMTAWARFALGVRRLGRRDMMEFLRVLPLSAYHYLNEHFESDALKGLLASFSTTGLMQGPRASGTAFMFLYQQMGGANGGYRSSLVPRGGVGQLSSALAHAAQGFGAQVRTGAPVQSILVASGSVHGVRLSTGEEISAKSVLSSVDPRTTFLGLLGAPQLEPRISCRLRSLKLRGSTATVHLALNGVPDFPAATDPQLLTGTIVICPSLDYAERAFDDAKHGRVSTHPVLEARIPSLLDPGYAPAGKHTMSMIVRYAPYRLREGDWESRRERLADLAVETLAQHAPGFLSLILDRKVITPLDYEREYGLAEGGELHGQMGLDQMLLMRPVPGFIGYHSPIAGLYICGAGAHPGGGVTGAPGLNAARQANAELR
ncbi:MAG: NAD(P)/FAD-dependent oxidoreductase [Anaerolineales bacterium]